MIETSHPSSRCTVDVAGLRSIPERRAHLACAFLAALLASCAAPPPEVTPHMATYAGGATKIPELEMGRHIFVTACAKCHSLDTPTAFSTEEWKRIVDKMAEPAKISQKQQAVLLQYLLSARSELRDSTISR